MRAYRAERIENAVLFFARNHYQKTKNYLSQTALYKYLAFFEFRYLKQTGDMPLELTYKAMKRGPVPVEIYENRDNPSYFHKVIFEPFKTGYGNGYRIRPNGEFNSDYFAEAELSEMNNLVEVFAQKWVGSSEMSGASHESIQAWKKAFKRSQNAIIDPVEEFDRDLSG
ncbi:MAG: SocA family protein, partial [Spirochaetaceae bacterium]|nr:SocA family protein [Spirochaetaceae bacterium]